MADANFGHASWNATGRMPTRPRAAHERPHLHEARLQEIHRLSHLIHLKCIVARNQHLRPKLPRQCTDELVVAAVEYGHLTQQVLVQQEEDVLL